VAHRIFSGSGGATRFWLAAAVEFGGWGVYYSKVTVHMF